MRSIVSLMVILSMSCMAAAQSTTQPAKNPTTRPFPVVRVGPNINLESNIGYGEFADQRLDVMWPKDSTSEKRPGVVVFHGGGWIQSNKESTMNALCNPYLAQGFVVCNVEYRCANTGLSPAKAPAAVEDSLLAAKWFVDHADRYNMDVNRLVITGASAGGHLALMVGMTTPEAELGPVVKVAAIVNGYGPTDVQDMIDRQTRANTTPPGFAVQWLPEQEGRAELAKRLSPMTYVRKDLPPILTVQGSRDNTVPVVQNQRLTEALKAAGADAELILIEGAGHGFTNQWADVNRQIFEFLRKRNVLKSAT
jgi:acetyl esterase/lipase